MTVRMLVVVVLASAASVAGGLAGGCGTSDEEAPTFTRDALLDPATCGGCHEDHFQEWSGSMHAYAAEDPVFLAMNRAASARRTESSATSA